MHTNSNESGENIPKHTNTQPIQINATAKEQCKNNTYKNIPLNQTQHEEHRNEKLQQHQVIGYGSIITIENQLIEFRKKQQQKFTKTKRSHVSPKSNENLHKWDRNTTFIVGDSMLSGIEERRFSKRDRNVKVKNFFGALIDDMYGYI